MIITPVTPEFMPPDQPPVLMASAGAATAAGPAGRGVVLTAQNTAAGAPAPAAPAGELAPVSNASVTYQGTTLVVDGQSYPRAAASPARGFAPGRLVVSPESGHPISEMETLITRLGLRIERALGGTPPIGWLIAVPVGFELQWQAALMRQPAVMSVDVDGRMTIQPRLNSGPSVVR
ncbi:MAG: hypothetical protein RL375_2377 [Pseudomonadota bacterium]|jgi:hypothetical protein